MSPSNAIHTRVKRVSNLDSSDNPVAPDMPLYAVMTSDGHIEVIDPRDIEDTPRYTLTAEGREELPHEY